MDWWRPALFCSGIWPIVIHRTLSVGAIHSEGFCQWRTFHFQFRKSIDLLLVLISAVVNTVLSLVFLSAGYSFNSFIFAYSSPLVVLGSLYLFLFFSKLEMRQSRIINWMGASSFAVYLFHSQVDLRTFFTEVIIKLDASFHGFSTVGMILLFLILTFIVSVCLDQIRIVLWNRLLNRWKSTSNV